MQKTLRLIVLFLFHAEAVLFTVAILSSSFRKGLYYLSTYQHVWLKQSRVKLKFETSQLNYFEVV